ncbi:MAG: DUF4271 domain-containing protein [Salinivirgaceae bacterium]|nr:DUF4271 domain-containing protein [Salinivirgaceae bacterium]MDD4747237.1 DUF4271 domain-containing protein [Salinivirgaceae bacterium]MDY0279836.1 DUF4271 domain-containing protein [Salinivirgaceae bacterium]
MSIIENTYKHSDNDTIFVTSISDIPIYDVLGKKYYASPDQFEFQCKNFKLNDIEPSVVERIKWDFDPILNVHTNNDYYLFSRFTEQQEVNQITPKQVASKQEPIEPTRNKNNFSSLDNKEIQEQTTILNLIPIVKKTEEQHQTILIKNLLIRKPLAAQKQFGSVDWATGVFIGLLILVTYTRVSFGKFFRPIISAMFAYNLSSRIYIERNIVINRLSTILNFLFVLTFVTFLALGFDYYGFRITIFNKIETYFVLLALFFILYTIRKLIHFLLSAIFNLKETIQEYSFHGNLFIKLLGIIILPLIITIPYLPENHVNYLFIIILALISIVYLMRIFRIFSLTIRKGFSIFYLILYLCALEIGPCIVLLKVFDTII